jgi:hypothetical protein
LIGSSLEEEKKDISENVEKKTEDEEKMYDLEYFKKNENVKRQSGNHCPVVQKKDET